MTMFSRPEKNYAIGDSVIESIITDAAHPLGLISKIIPDGSKILDVGAGSGVLARLLVRAGKSVVIDGVEPNRFAASFALPLYRHLYVGYAGEFIAKIKEENYDYVVLADVMEHTPDPMAFMSEILDCLGDEVKILISVPNVAFGGVRLALMNGRFSYVDSGLLERTHLRFFTLSSALSLFEGLAIKVENISILGRSFYRTEFSRKELASNPFRIISLALNREARAYQYLFALSRATSIDVEISYHGAGPLKIIFESLVAWPWVMRLVRKYRGA